MIVLLFVIQQWNDGGEFESGFWTDHSVHLHKTNAHPWARTLSMDEGKPYRVVTRRVRTNPYWDDDQKRLSHWGWDNGEKYVFQLVEFVVVEPEDEDGFPVYRIKAEFE